MDVGRIPDLSADKITSGTLDSLLLPIATNSVLGGVKEGTNITIDANGVISTSYTNLLNDTTPQLGGNLDVNGMDIVSVSNGDINFNPSASGQVVIKGNSAAGGISGSIKLNCENNSHGVTIIGPPHSAFATYTLTLPNNTGNPNEVLTTNGSGIMSWTNVSYSLPIATNSVLGGVKEGTNITIDANGVISTSYTNLLNDTTPQLGGNLDVNGMDIVSVSNGDINFNPSASGQVVIKGNSAAGGISGSIKLNCADNSHGVIIKAPHSVSATYGLILPDSDGNPNQIISTDGSGNLSFIDQNTSGNTYSSITELDVPTLPANNKVLSSTPSGLQWIDQATSSTYSLPVATNSILGGVKEGTNITIDANGVISASSTYSLPVATNSILGGVKVDGSTITISNGVISSTGGGGGGGGDGSSYTLPTSTTSELGGVKVDGSTITITNGVISSTGIATSPWYVNGNDISYTPGNVTISNSLTLDKLYINVTNYLSTITGEYGSIQLNGSGGNNWEGYSIDGRVVFMHDGSNSWSIYDDVNNKNCISGTFSSATNLYYNGISKLSTYNSGVDIVGTLRATGDITAYYSDNRLKHRVANIENVLPILQKIKAFKYTANSVAQQYGFDNSKVEIGLSAQEINAQFPELVSLAPFDTDVNTNKSISGKNYLTLKYERLIPVLLTGINELSDKNSLLQKKNKELENKIYKLQEKYNLLENKINDILNYIL